MHWTTQPFLDFQEVVQSISSSEESTYQASIPGLIHYFNVIFDDLKNYLQTAKKSDASRQELQKRKTFKLLDEEYSSNETLVTNASTLADELDIDELIAAELLLASSDDETMVLMNYVGRGVLMFYQRRQFILNIILYLLVEPTRRTNPLTQQLQKFVSKLATGSDLFTKTVQAMDSIENMFVELEEKEKRGQILGQTQNIEFVKLLRLRRDFLTQEHDKLGQILGALVENGLVGSSGFSKVLERLQKQSVYDTLFIHYLPAVLLYSSHMDVALKQTSHPVLFPDAYKIFKQLKTGRDNWKLPYMRGAIELIFLSSFTALCLHDSAKSASIDVEQDVISPIKKAIDDGALEMLMCLAADTSAYVQQQPTQPNDFRNVLQSRVPQLKEVGILLDDLLTILVSELELFVESFVTNLADILKEMRLSEEDSYLALQEAEEPVDDVPGVDLERFFILVSYLYVGRPNASIPFWNDTEGNLHGFIVWASQSQVAFASAAFCDMLASLSFGRECADAVFKFLKDGSPSKALVRAKRPLQITWDYIHEAIVFYINHLKPNVNPQPPMMGNARVMIPVQELGELDDDTILILHSYFRLLAEVIRSDPSAREAFFKDSRNWVATLFQLLQFHTSLAGPILNVITSFAQSESRTQLLTLWEALDSWAFNSTIYGSDGTVMLPTMPAKDRLYHLMKSLSDTFGFIRLVEALLRPCKNDSGQSSLPYPDDLGNKYRVPGVWPYVDYLIKEVFYSSAASEFSQNDRLALQIPCLKFMEHALELFDPELARLASTVGVNPDVLVDSPSFISYLKVHPCAPTMSYLFSEKIYNILIGIVSTGIDEISDKSPSDPAVQVIVQSLKVINLILDLQSAFIDIVIKELKHSADGGSFVYSTHGLRSFEDALLFNLPMVTQLALYIRSENIELAYDSLQLLERVSVSPQFMAPSGSSHDSRIRRNRLLSALETVDESIRIKEGVVDQLNRDYTQYEETPRSVELGLDGIHIKLKLLHFLIANLKNGQKEPSIAHFILGFKISGDGSLEFDDERGGILSSVSAFDSVLHLLRFAVDATDRYNIGIAQTQLASACSEIVLLLIENQNSCQLVLDYLRENNYFLGRLGQEPTVDAQALWEDRLFSDSATFLASESSKAMISFFNHRTALLEYLSTELHVSAGNGTLSLVNRYLESLVSLEKQQYSTGTFGTKSARILSFLDVLEFQSTDGVKANIGAINVFGSQVTERFYQIETSSSSGSRMDGDGDEAAVNELAYLLKIKGFEFVAQKKISSLNDADYVNACRDALDSYVKIRAARRIRNSQLNCLKAWAKLVLVVVNDAKLSAGDRSTFVLEAFQAIIPKLVDYASRDVMFSEQLAYLAVSLFRSYQTDVKLIAQSSVSSSKQLVRTTGNANYDRTHALFKAALSAIQTPLTTPELRSDLYIICYQYLKQCLEVGPVKQLKQNLQVVRTCGDKLLELICSDAISGEGVSRLTALILLEVLCRLSAATSSTFVLDGLVRYNLLLLLVKSTKRLDNEITSRKNQGEDQLFYEINVFKATLYFLLQVAQTRAGANKIIQFGLFNVLQSCQFLKIDPDVGLLSEGYYGGPDSTTKNVEKGQATFYDLLIPVFQVVVAILLSMGSENQPVISTVRQFLEHHHQLVVAILKKDVLGSTNRSLQDLVKLLVLLMTLTDYTAKP
ncbi:nucleoporin Nup192p [Trichomonascus vanleenenianus]|uniref:Nup192p n=1 Tax=Trichomonascus vanleenenianus TaxID=2268995 RepID=UPI003ECA2B62